MHERAIPVSQCDAIFISFDEPTSESHWSSLLRMRADAKRVHGVVGLDRAHRVAGEIADTDFVVTIDGDTVVDTEFWATEFEAKGSDVVISYASRNPVNGLEYGNGSVKVWPKTILREVSSHARSNDFVNDHKLFVVGRTIATHYFNSTPYTALRSGFREGFKLFHGAKQLGDGSKGMTTYRRLVTWATVGSHAQNGLFCILGCRLGIILAASGMEPTRINQYDALNEVLSNFVRLEGAELFRKVDEVGRQAIAVFEFDSRVLDEDESSARAQQCDVRQTVGYLLPSAGERHATVNFRK